MAMSLPISTPSAGNSPSSDGSSNPPRTPVSPGVHTVTLPAPPQSADSQHSGQMKRKPSRRANTAERRATHNAVERQRRETLNGRFLDLAALLPNLSQIRRPSKSSIVNSSIAHIHASRRHRLLASRELRILKLESDALRRELNEWRDRAGLPRVEEPVRGEGFTMVLSGEIEVLAAIPGEEDEEGGQDYDGYDEGNDEFNGVAAHSMGSLDDTEELLQRNQIALLKNANANANANANNSYNGGGGHMMARGVGPMIATNQSNVSFENPAMASLYEPHHQQQQQQQQQHFPFLHQMTQDPLEKWNPQLFSMQPQQQQQQQQRAMFSSPPSSAHGLSPSTTTSTTASNNNNPFADPAFFANLQRHQMNSNMGHMYGSPIEGDDASSCAGSIHNGGGSNGRQRSGSLSNGSNGYLTPPHASSSPVGNFDLSSVMSEVGRRASAPSGLLHINTGSGGVGGVGVGGWRNDVVEGMGMGMSMMKQNLSPPISVGGGGGGNGGGFMSMMF